jgi:hypothetical protein
MTTSPRTALSLLFSRLFSEHELRWFLGESPQGDALARGLPGSPVSMEQLCNAAVNMLDDRGLLDQDLFTRLKMERPDREGEIDAVGRSFAGHLAAEKAGHEGTDRAAPILQRHLQHGSAFLYVSYVADDEPLLHELEHHLAMLQHQGLVRVWHRGRVGRGEEWEAHALDHLARADLIVLLLSVAYIANDFCYDLEFLRAARRGRSGSARVLAAICRPCDLGGPLFQEMRCVAWFPGDYRPIASMPSKDAAWLEIANGIRTILSNRSAAGDPASAAGKPVTSPSVIGETAIDLDRVPLGPKVPDHLVTGAMIDAYAELYGGRPAAEQLLRDATRLRLNVDPHGTYIKAGHLPDIVAGADAYWHEVFHEACRHGPRMVAAILLSAKVDLLSPAARRDCARLLRFLLNPVDHGRLIDR